MSSTVLQYPTPPIKASRQQRLEELCNEIEQLKKQRNAVILAHLY